MSTQSKSVFSQLIDCATQKAGSQAGLARELDWQLRALTRVRGGEKISPYRAARLAEYLKISIDGTMALALIESARTADEGQYWRKRFASQLAEAEREMAEEIINSALHEQYDRPANDGALLQSVAAGLGIETDDELGALLAMSKKDFAEVRAGRRRLTVVERLRVLDRAGAIKTRKLLEALVPERIADQLENWVVKSVRADAAARMKRAGKK